MPCIIFSFVIICWVWSFAFMQMIEIKHRVFCCFEIHFFVIFNAFYTLFIHFIIISFTSLSPFIHKSKLVQLHVTYSVRFWSTISAIRIPNLLITVSWATQSKVTFHLISRFIANILRGFTRNVGSIKENKTDTMVLIQHR